MTAAPLPTLCCCHRGKPGTPAFRWLYAALRGDILAGRLRPGSRLPATRDLAAQYGLSRGTVVSAFEELKSEGYLHGSRGSGTYVSSVLPENLLQVAPEPRPKLSVSKQLPRRLSGYGLRVQPFSNLESRPTRAFRANLPALDLFPTKIWTRLAERRLRRLSIPQLLGCDTMGYLPLRIAVADYLNTSRGTRCNPQQVMIVSGTQEALDLAARLILNPGDQVCVEEPGYPGAAMAFEALGAKICPVPVDSEGMELPGAGARKAKLVYVTPGHQFPVVHDHEPGAAPAIAGMGSPFAVPLFSRTITIASFAMPGGQSLPCRVWISTDLVSLPEASARCSFPRCVSAIWCFHPISSIPSQRRNLSSTGMLRPLNRLCCATLSSKATSDGTCGACAKSMPSASRS